MSKNCEKKFSLFLQTVLTAKTGCDIQNMYLDLSFELLQVGTTKKLIIILVINITQLMPVIYREVVDSQV